MSIYNEKHRPHYVKFHLLTPKSKKIDLEYFSRTGYSTRSYGVCGRTKTTDIYIDRMILCGCKSIIQKMIYLFKKKKKTKIDNIDIENTNCTNNDFAEEVCLGGQQHPKVETLSKPSDKKEKTPHISNF